MIRVVVAEDHVLVREGIKKVLRPLEDVRLLGAVENLAQMFRLLESQEADLAILGLGPNGNDELEGLRLVRKKFPDLPILILSTHSEGRFGVQALKMGARGYVTKSMCIEEFVNAIRRIGQGGHYVSARLAEILAASLASENTLLPHYLLTVREAQVMRLLGSGMQIKTAAAELNLSISSVNTYRARIFKKLGVRSNAALVRYVIEHRLIT